MGTSSDYSYGHIWADWLYDHEKDSFMAGVYDDCHAIDRCTDPVAKAKQLGLLRDRVHGSTKAWVEGVEDFIDFEGSYLAHGQAPLEILDDSDDFRVLAILQASFLHGAFRGLCRTPSGAEWIGKLGEMCAAAVHQGFKWLRQNGVTEWELPSAGEAWCKGTAMWALACMPIAVDVAGADPDNDAALERMHAVIAAHHCAGVMWSAYRGEHPHKWWSADVRGRAPGEAAIRRFGEEHGWPEDMVAVLVRGAKHVNSWTNLPFDPVHQERMRGFLVGDHTPRLKTRLRQVWDEMKDAVQATTDDLTVSEVEECKSRIESWGANITAHWRGRGDDNDRVRELMLLGALPSVLRESRPHVTAEFVQRMVEWSRPRVAHLSLEQQELMLGAIQRCLETRGRVPGAAPEFSSAGSGDLRFVEGAWDLTVTAIVLGSIHAEKGLPANLIELITRFFNAWTGKRRIVGKDIEAWPDPAGGCPVCVGDALFLAQVDNRPTTGVHQVTIWGTLMYHNLGLGEPDDTSLGSHPEPSLVEPGAAHSEAVPS
ncbi:hypothetical protein [Streptomyces sp. NPDC055287]